jgi:predicted transcriptional regulator
MRHEKIQYLSDKDLEVVDLLIKIGLKKNVAKVLIFLSRTPEATSIAIERGTDLRQPEVSVAIKSLMNQELVGSYDIPRTSNGRPLKVYSLTKSSDEIADHLRIQKKKDMENQMALIKKLEDYF